MQFLEFRRRFEILVTSGSKPNEPIVDEKEVQYTEISIK